MRSLAVAVWESSTLLIAATPSTPLLHMTGNIINILMWNEYDRQTMKAVAASHLGDLGDDYKHFDVIGIDEGQFFQDVRIRL